VIDWLLNNFDSYTNEDNEEYIVWETERETIMKVKLSSIVEMFGDEVLTKDEMMDRATVGWKSIIERWDELGKFN